MVKDDVKSGKKCLEDERARDYWTKKEFSVLKNILKEVINGNYEEINDSIHWSVEELDKLKEIKERRKRVIHQNRFS